MVVGYIPVAMLLLLGEQTGETAKKLSYTIPLDANSSRLGVFAIES